MQKGSAQLLLILLCLTFIVGSIYYYQSSKSNSLLQSPKFTPKEPESKDYSNPLGFQFKYSKDLMVKDDTEEKFNKRGGGDFRKNFKGYVVYEPGKFLSGVAVLDKTGSYDTNPFILWVFDNPQDLSIDAWYKNYWYYPFVWGDFTYTGKFELAPKQESTVSGQLAKSGIIDYQPGKPKFVYLNHEKKMYLFRIIGESGDKILQSFKFSQ